MVRKKTPQRKNHQGIHADHGSSQEQMVLFVCVENTFRSILGEAIFNAQAPDGWRAESAGVHPAAAINPDVVDLLQEIGIQLGPKNPRTVTPELIRQAQRVITFGCLDQCPTGAQGKSEDWPLPTAAGKTRQELRGIRDELRARITRLLGSLRAQTQPIKLTASPHGRSR
jgi:arsenate reductase (thioredoxin)